jgi:hypothetical protein
MTTWGTLFNAGISQGRVAGLPRGRVNDLFTIVVVVAEVTGEGGNLPLWQPRDRIDVIEAIERNGRFR